MNETINTPKEPTPDVELKLIFDTMQRFRESTIENKLSDRPDLRQYVDSQLGGTLKERFLRSVGLGCASPVANQQGTLTSCALTRIVLPRVIAPIGCLVVSR